MNLEQIEKRCLEMLKYSQRALVPFSNILACVREEPESAQVKPEELLTFLRNHELFKVFDPIFPFQRSPLGNGETTLFNEPSVALCTRLPSKREIEDLMAQQLDVLIRTLEEALEEGNSDDSERETKLNDLLARAYSLRERLARP